MKQELSFITKVLMAVGMAIGCCLILAAIITRKSEPKCSPLPGSFTDAEMIGTWIAGSPDQRDTLIINADGTYKQTVHIEFDDRSSIAYESDWQSWYVEYTTDHLAYLHLAGFSFCGMNPAISCEERNGGGYDFCRDESIRMENEGILLILTLDDGQSPAKEVSGYTNWLVYPLGSENSWSYTHQEP